MNLYILTPHSNHFNNYNQCMNYCFNLKDWSEAVKGKDININYIEPNSKINPNYNKDYILVTDIDWRNKEYCDDFIFLFNKKNRFVMLYECMKHNVHKWKYKYVLCNFSLIFQNCMFLVDNKKIFWIPCYNINLKHEDYKSTKDHFCCVSPIFDLAKKGLSQKDKKRLQRINIIKEFCSKEKKIHVYGSDDWKDEIPKENFIGKLPNEDHAGIDYFNWEYKIKNKCNLLSKYKFNLVFENLFVDGFVSEKLVESLYSNSVVIYYGPKNIEEMYPELFNFGVINGHKYKVDQIINIMKNMDQKEYLKRINVIRNHRDNLNWENSIDNIKKIVINKIINYVNEGF